MHAIIQAILVMQKMQCKQKYQLFTEMDGDQLILMSSKPISAPGLLY